MNELITVPTFTFSQGEIFEGAENPVRVCYYNNGDSKLIELSQEDRSINFSNLDQLKKLVKLVEKHLPEASIKLEK
jgi:hypothetical protein